MTNVDVILSVGQLKMLQLLEKEARVGRGSMENTNREGHKPFGAEVRTMAMLTDKGWAVAHVDKGGDLRYFITQRGKKIADAFGEHEDV